MLERISLKNSRPNLIIMEEKRLVLEEILLEELNYPKYPNRDSFNFIYFGNIMSSFN